MSVAQPESGLFSPQSDDLFGKSAEIAEFLMPADPNNAVSGAVWKQISFSLTEILDAHYARLWQYPTAHAQRSAANGKLPGLSELQTKHMERVFLTDINRVLAEDAQKTAMAHLQSGLTADWFIAGYGRLLMETIPVILKAHRFTPQRASEVIRVLIARLFMDMALAENALSGQTSGVEADEWREDNDYQNLRTVSNSMADLNKVTLNLAMLSDSATKSSASSESVAAAVEQLVASISQLTDTSQSAAHDAEDTNDALRRGVEGMVQAREAIATVSHAADRSSESLSSLRAAAAEISSFMNIIQSIADQTNLLALNATIEAARAGDAGRGFAVVASEVKILATQTASATEDVAARIRTLQNGIRQISEHFEATKSAIETGEGTLSSASGNIEIAGRQMETLSGRMSEVAHILEQQNASASEISAHVTSIAGMARENEICLDDISVQLQAGNNRLSESATRWFKNSSGRSLCEMAKIDHVLFRKRTVDAVLERGSWKSQEVPDNHSCRLGKWYDTITDTELRSLEAFRNLDAPHKRVHDAAVEALRAKESGKSALALEALRRLDEASDEVISGLNAVSDFLHKRESISERRNRERKPVYGETAELRSGSKTIRTSVLDEAARGIGVEGIDRTDIGQKVQVDYKGKKLGTVRWSNGRRGGIEFEN